MESKKVLQVLDKQNGASWWVCLKPEQAVEAISAVQDFCQTRERTFFLMDIDSSMWEKVGINGIGKLTGCDPFGKNGKNTPASEVSASAGYLVVFRNSGGADLQREDALLKTCCAWESFVEVYEEGVGGNFLIVSTDEPPEKFKGVVRVIGSEIFEEELAL